MTYGPVQSAAAASPALDDLLLTANPDALILTTLQGRIVHWNPGASTIFGHGIADALGRSVDDLLISADHLRDAQRALARAAVAGVGRIETIALRVDGTPIYIDFLLRRIVEHGDDFMLWAGRDVTQPRLLRAALTLDARYGDLLESTPDGILLVGETGHIVLANAQAERMFGYGPGELQGMLAERLVPQTVGAPPSSHRSGHRPQPSTSAKDVGKEVLGRRKSGEEFPVEVSLSPLQTDDGPVVVSAVRDVSDRMHAARRFRALLEAAPDAIVITDAQGHIVLANSQTDALFGYTREELVGRPVEVLLPERFRLSHVAHREGFAAHAKFRAMGAGLELYARHKDGREFPVEVSLSPISTEEGMLTSAAIRDITERKAVERQLQEQNIELARASEAKTNFLAGMSHELRTPLNAIIGFTGTLLMRLPGPLNEEQEKQLRTVQWAGQHLLALINDLLDLTRVESGEVQVELRPVRCAEIAREAATQVRSQAEAKGLELRMDLPDGEIVIASDRRALTQILMNLLANAVKYTETGHVCLVLRAAGPRTHFVIEDTGIGIQPADRERLFKAFSRLDRGNEKRQGTGLGLYLSARLARLLGGRIEVESEVGRGSRFILDLPGS